MCLVWPKQSILCCIMTSQRRKLYRAFAFVIISVSLNASFCSPNYGISMKRLIFVGAYLQFKKVLYAMFAISSSFPLL